MASKVRLWIDVDNTPHVQFFAPIIKELEGLGWDVVITARDCAQTKGMLELFGLRYYVMGRHKGRNDFLKVWGVLERTPPLFCFGLLKGVTIAATMGSRGLPPASWLLGIPSMAIVDYEGISLAVYEYFSTVIYVPRILYNKVNRFKRNKKYCPFEGFKEEAYVPDYPVRSGVLESLGLDSSEVTVALRPPAQLAHYHSPLTDVLFWGIVEYLLEADVQVVVLPRYGFQKLQIRQRAKDRPGWVVLSKPVDGISLLAEVDLLIGGGGTMNREAAVLGTPVYSFFTGKKPVMDEYLEERGYLSFVESMEEVYSIPLVKASKRTPFRSGYDVKQFFVDALLKLGGGHG